MSELKLHDYALYYIGCKCINTWFHPNHEAHNAGWELIGFKQNNTKCYLLQNETDETWTDSIKIILRHLSDMTKEEENELEKIKGTRLIPRPYPGVEIKFDTPDTFHWMIKKQFDLFSLIENSLAVDSKTFKQKPYNGT